MQQLIKQENVSDYILTTSLSHPVANIWPMMIIWRITTTVLRPSFQDSPGEPVPEEN